MASELTEWEKQTQALRERFRRREPVTDEELLEPFRAAIRANHIDDDIPLERSRDQLTSLARYLEKNADLFIKNHREDALKIFFNELAGDRTGAALITTYMDDLHLANNEERFAFLQVLSWDNEVNLIRQTSDYMYTSTYNGVLNDLLKDLKEQKADLGHADVGLDSAKDMVKFLSVAATFNRIDTRMETGPDGKKKPVLGVLDFIPADKWPGITQQLAEQIASASDSTSASFTLVKLMSAASMPPEQRAAMERMLKDRYEQANQRANTATDPATKAAAEKERDRFGLAASAYGTYAANPTASDSFFTDMAKNERYKMPDNSTLEKERLQQPNTASPEKLGANYQLMVFPSVKKERESGNNDHDSMNSFNHWMQQYQGKPGWQVEVSKDGYVHITGKPTTPDGLPVNIYAADPRRYEEGLAAIKKRVAAEQGKTPDQNPSFSVVVNRGHSTYTGDYLNWVDKNTSLVVLGSCGDHRKLAEALKASPQVQVVATQGVGEMAVNDPLLFYINQSIAKNGRIDWADIRKRLDADKAVPEGKRDYVLPNQDSGQALAAKSRTLSLSAATPPMRDGFLLGPRSRDFAQLIPQDHEPTPGKHLPTNAKITPSNAASLQLAT